MFFVDLTEFRESKCFVIHFWFIQHLLPPCSLLGDDHLGLGVSLHSQKCFGCNLKANGARYFSLNMHNLYSCLKKIPYPQVVPNQ